MIRQPIDSTTRVKTAALGMTGAGRRILGLDGLRGVAGIAVVISHYFAEVPHGIRALSFGWLAVDIFFVLSGFLIGKLILEKKESANFFVVFYARRIFRLFPAYVVTVLVVSRLLHAITAHWADADVSFPVAAYLTFLQGFWMVSTNSIGAHWLAPTWTLAVEEHFYLLVPALIVFTPRRWLVPVLALIAVVAILVRVAAGYGGAGPAMAALVLLPGRADLLILGVLAACLNASASADWRTILPVLRVAPIIGLLLAAVCRLADETLFNIVGPTIVGASCAAFILCIVRGAPEGARLEAPVLRFLGDNSYCLYLTHLPVLGLLHGLLLGRRPGLETPAQWAVTLFALPVCVVVGRGMTKLIEEPFMDYARRWRWQAKRVQAAA